MPTVVISKIRTIYREISRGPAGQRFSRYHRLRSEGAGPGHALLYGGAGAVLVVCGFLLSLPPLMPGFLLWLPGMALIASQSATVAHALDWLEPRVRRIYRHISHGHRGQ